MIRALTTFIRLPGFVLVCLLWQPGLALAQDDFDFCPIFCPKPDAPPLHYAYAVRFGTGTYEIGDRRAYVIRITPSGTIRREGPERIGVRIKVPFALGYVDFDNDDILGSFGNVTSLSIVPGAVIRVPVNPDWFIQANGYLGIGHEFDGDDDALIWMSGVGSLLILGPKKRFRLYNGLEYFGFNADDGEHDDILDIVNGFEIAIPIRPTVFGNESVLRPHFTGHYYPNRMQFTQLNGKERKLEWELEFGLAFGPRKVTRIYGLFDFDRVGVAYRFSNDGILQGVKFFLSSPFG